MAATPKKVINIEETYDGPLEVVVTNKSTGANAMTEVRVLNDAGKALDLGITGSSYYDPLDSTLGPNEGFLVGESGLGEIKVKQNNPSPISFWIGDANGQSLRRFTITRDALVFTSNGVCLVEVHNTVHGTKAEVLCDNGNVYAGAKSSHPFHLMTNRTARATVLPSGGLEIWNSSAPGGLPSHGAFIWAENGQIKIKDSSGNVGTYP